MNNQYHFIRTSDPDVIKYFRDKGYAILSQDGKYYTFLNDTHIQDFSHSPQTTYTNKLNI